MKEKVGSVTLGGGSMQNSSLNNIPMNSNTKAPIHEATLLPVTVACNNVAACMMQCCVVARCRQLLLGNRTVV